MEERPAQHVASDGDPELARLLAEMVEAGAVTAASAVLSEGAARRMAWAGWRRVPAESGETGIPLAPSDLFDLASLTKPISASVALRWDAAGRLPLETRLGEIWESVASPLAGTTLEDLLRHAAGFSRWAPLYSLCEAPREVAPLLLSGELLGAEGAGYSDLDYILWGLSVERALGVPLEGLLAQELAELGATAPRPRPAPSLAVECGMDGRREAALAESGGWPRVSPKAPEPGVVQDGNARFLGGMAGHAGLFGSAAGMGSVLEAWLFPGGWLPEEGVERALSPRRTGSASVVLGWTRPGAWERSAGSLPARAFGHIGFTGGSVWFERSSRRGLVLTAHRASPSSDPDPWRQRLHARLAATG